MIFILAAVLDFAAALMHLAIIAGGPAWYRAFGAGDALAEMAERKHWWPALITSLIALVLVIWGLYFLSLGGLIMPLPFLRPVCLAIIAILAIRGVLPLILFPWVAECRTRFSVLSSIIVAAYALVHTLAWLAAQPAGS